MEGLFFDYKWTAQATERETSELAGEEETLWKQGISRRLSEFRRPFGRAIHCNLFAESPLKPR